MKSLFLLAIAFTGIACNGQPGKTSNTEGIVFKGVNLIPMDQEQVIENQDVWVKDGRILKIAASGQSNLPANTLIVDGKGRYLMPGLAEMHAHVPQGDDIAPMKDVLLLYAVNGITTIRGMLGHPKHLVIKKMIASGEMIGPQFYTAGPGFSGQSAKNPEAAAAMVSEQKKAGYDFLKMLPGLSRETFAAIEQRAKQEQIPFAGHVSFDVGIWRAIDAGYASIDHLDGFIEGITPGISNMKEQEIGLFAMFISQKADTTRIAKLTAALKDHHIWVVPTQALAERWFSPDQSPQALSQSPEMVYMSSETINDWINAKTSLMKNASYDSLKLAHFIRLRRQLISACNKSGVGILSGSDAPQVFDVPGFSLHQELKYMVDAGLTPYEALRTSTVNVAGYFNKTDEGTIKEGAKANLLLLNANPLTDINNTKAIEAVLLGSHWMPRSFIDSTLTSLKKH